MRQTLFALALVACFSTYSQQIVLKKGIVVDSVKVLDSIPETFSLYLPSNFDSSKTWPVTFVFDMKGRGKQVVGMFMAAAEKNGYILASSNNVNDSLAISENILASSRMFNTVFSMFPIQNNRVYVGGFDSGARFSSLVPTFIKDISGVISLGAAVPNIDILTTRNTFHFIGIVGNEDYNYPDMLSLEKILDKLKFPNQLLVFEGGHEWPPAKLISRGFENFTLAAMAKGIEKKDDGFVDRTYDANLAEAGTFITENKPLIAERMLAEMAEVYRPFKSIDSIKESIKTLKKGKYYKPHARKQNALLLKESFIKEDYDYYLEEDIVTYNFNNLGWWKYQMEELDKYDKGSDIFEKQMGKRLRGYINALIHDNIDLLNLEAQLDFEALNFLYMLNTITDPTNSRGYLNVISNSSRMEDYGTALFYLEELLKSGYQDRDSLYEIEHTALLRITPEYNKIVEQYLKEARYDVIEQ
ncbi:MAG: alpha/beta hydrolase [Flavobacteriaceae bacterium]